MAWEKEGREEVAGRREKGVRGKRKGGRKLQGEGGKELKGEGREGRRCKEKGERS